MATKGEIVYHLVTVLLVLIFSLTSAIKLVPHLFDNSSSREIVNAFTLYVSYPPASFLKLSAETYRVLVGAFELAMVVLMLVGYRKRRSQVLTSYGLLVLMVGALYTHVIVGDHVEKLFPAGFCLALVLTRMYVLGVLGVHLKFD